MGRHAGNGRAIIRHPKKSLDFEHVFHPFRNDKKSEVPEQIAEGEIKSGI
jgi:hypothetical protein